MKKKNQLTSPVNLQPNAPANALPNNHLLITHMTTPPPKICHAKHPHPSRIHDIDYVMSAISAGAGVQACSLREEYEDDLEDRPERDDVAGEVGVGFPVRVVGIGVGGVVPIVH